MGSSYWSDMASRMTTRRRALRVSVGSAIGAGLLAACGGGSSSGSNTGAGGESSLVVKLKDTTAEAKRGGVLKDYAQAEPRTLDPVQPLADLNRIATFIYSTLLTAKPGKLAPATGELQGN